MEFNPKCVIEKAISRDLAVPHRHLRHPYLTQDANGNPVLVATDGHILAVVRVESENIEAESGMITKVALKAARKLAGRQNLAVIHAGKSLDLIDGSKLPRPESVVFPNWQRCVKQDETQARVFSIRLNPKLLADLASAIGSPEDVQIEFTGPGSPAKVTALNEVDAFGLIMPIGVPR